MSEKNKTDSIDLIAEIVQKIKGVSASKAYALAEFLDGDWRAFLEAKAAKIAQLVQANGKQTFSDLQIKDILGMKQEFFDYEDVRTAWIYCIGKNFLMTQITMLEEKSLSNLDINPFLMQVLDLKTPMEVLEFNLYQTVTRSIVTSWGTTVENLLIRCGAEKFIEKSLRPGRRPDLQKNLNGKKFYIQVKSGPNTMNVDMVNSLNEVISEYKEKEPDASFILGMTYGTKGRISSQIKDNLYDFDKSILIGRELWDFISGEKDFHKELFRILDQSSKHYTTQTFSEHLKARLIELVEEWKGKYGEKTLQEVYENHL